MSIRRPIVAATILMGLAAMATPAAQAPTLDEVLGRVAVYVRDFREQLAGIVAEETYLQEIADTSRSTNGFAMKAAKTLKSDLFLVRPSGADRYVELRDVFEVDGTPVRDRQGRLEQLLREGSGGEASISAIIAESARHNIGSIVRNINTPLMSLLFLDADNQKRFKFKHLEKSEPVFAGRKEAPAADETPVFRVSTEMWTIGYEERGRNTIIRSPNGQSRPAHGRFWINPSSGSILISELIVDTGGVIATVTVSYQSEPLMGFLVPIEMRESYIRYGERISGRAQYGKFRAVAK